MAGVEFSLFLIAGVDLSMVDVVGFVKPDTNPVLLRVEDKLPLVNDGPLA